MTKDSPRWIAARRRACSSAERKAAQSHSPLIPATASHLYRPQPAPDGASESLSEDSPKASRSAARQLESPPPAIRLLVVTLPPVVPDSTNADAVSGLRNTNVPPSMENPFPALD